jgi:hypothetical protein
MGDSKTERTWSMQPLLILSNGDVGDVLGVQDRRIMSISLGSSTMSSCCRWRETFVVRPSLTYLNTV